MARAWQIWRFLAVVATTLVPTWTQAAWLGYRNETPTVVIVQSASVVNNQIRPGKAHVLYPGEIAWDAVTSAGPRRLLIFDPKQNNRLLHHDTVNVQKLDIFLSVQAIPVPGSKGLPPSIQYRFLPARVPALPGATAPSPGNPKVPGVAPPPTGNDKAGVPPPPTAPKGGPPSITPPPRPGTPGNPNPPGNPPPSPKSGSR